MKKSDLKTGMYFEQANGDLFLILLNTPLGDVYVGSTGIHGKMQYFNTDLMSSTVEDIVKIYKCYYTNRSLSFDKERLELIWERKSVETIEIAGQKFDKNEVEKALKDLKPIE